MVTDLGGRLSFETREEGVSTMQAESGRARSAALGIPMLENSDWAKCGARSGAAVTWRFLPARGGRQDRLP